MSKAIKHMIVVVFMLLFLFSVLHLAAIYALPADTKPIPTVQEIITQWKLVDTDNEACGRFNYYLNPDPQARCTVAYVHYCIVVEGQVGQYGFLDNGKLREFVHFDGIGSEFYRSQPNLTKQLKSYLPIGTPI